MQLLVDRQDNTYSLCDAVSFVLMRQRGFAEALTTALHFEQEVFDGNSRQIPNNLLHRNEEQTTCKLIY